MDQNKQPLLFVDNESRSEQSKAIRTHVHGHYRGWNKLHRLQKRGRKAKIGKGKEKEIETDEGSQSISDVKSEGDVELMQLSRSIPRSPSFDPKDLCENSAIRITSPMWENIRLAEEFRVFRTWPDLWSSDVHERLRDRHKKHLQVAFQDEINIHVLLASGACVKNDRVGAYRHVHRAVALLRDRMPDLENSYYIVRLLMSVEFFLGNLEASRIHHRAAVKIAATQPELERSCVDPLPVADVWLARHSHQRTELDIDDWDPGPHTLGWIALGLSLPHSREILTGLHEVAVVMDQSLNYEEVRWLTMRVAALAGRLHNELLEGFDCPPIRLAAMCAMHVMFPMYEYTAQHRVWQRQYDRLLGESHCGRNQLLRLWLYFMGMVNERILGESGWARGQFEALQQQLGLSWVDVKGMLRRVVFVEKMEEVAFGGRVEEVEEGDEVEMEDAEGEDEDES